MKYGDFSNRCKVEEKNARIVSGESPIRKGPELVGYIRLARSLVRVGESLDHVYRVFYLTLYIIAIPSILLAFFFTRAVTSKMGDRP